MAIKAQYLVLTDHSITAIANRYYTSKKKILEPKIVESLRNIVKMSSSDYETLHRLLNAQKQVLEYACEVFAIHNLTDAFNKCVEELDIVQNILTDYTRDTKPEIINALTN
jgi:hypothetical protein